MAKLVKKLNSLQVQRVKILLRAAVRCALAALAALALAGLCLWMLFGRSVSQPYLQVGAAVGLALAALGLWLFILHTTRVVARERRILQAGLQGEQRAAALFAKLPEEYIVLSDLKVHYRQKESQIDHVVVGPTGVFAVETKNLRGLITGDGEAKQWHQQKRGAGGRSYHSDFYNPQDQVGTHVFRLAGLLRENGRRTSVKGMVFFVHPDARLQVRDLDPWIPVYAVGEGGAEAMLREIRRAPRSLDRHTIRDIVQIILEDNRSG